MLFALQASRPTSRLRTVFAALLCSALIGGPAASTALAQGTLVAPPQTKEEAAEAREAAAENDEGVGISLEAALAVTGLLLLGGATWYMIRDSRHATGMDDPRRQAPPVTPSSTRGAPKTMFEGEARPGGQVGKSKKREKAKRQKQARRANRPR